jgi:dGTPase
MSAAAGPERFEERRQPEPSRPDDVRNPFERDKGRVIHSAAFRRLQGKTQVMGTSEGDFHRTRLTHSIEVGQIGEGILLKLSRTVTDPAARAWLPDRSLVLATCHAHDLGHPPYGHDGEVAIHGKMKDDDGFEGNGQTLRVLTRLEKYRARGVGLNPTRRLLLAVLKYPVPYSAASVHVPPGVDRPPKCYMDTECDTVDWILEPFADDDRHRFTSMDADGRPLFKSFDCSIMDCADDIAYAVHDLEDAIGRRMVIRDQFEAALDADDDGLDFDALTRLGLSMDRDTLQRLLFSAYSHDRKQAIAALVNFFVTHVTLVEVEGLAHPLLRWNAALPPEVRSLCDFLMDFTRRHVIRTAEVVQLRRKGRRLIAAMFDEFLTAPEELIPRSFWDGLDPSESVRRRVCDYVAGMTDAYAERVWRRLFEPGYGNSTDEL